MSTRAARSLRGAAFAILATVSAAVAHTLGGGGAPSPLFCAALAALVLPVTVALAGPRVRAGRTWLSLGVAQAAFHAAFSAIGDPAATGLAAHTGHTAHAGPVALLATATTDAAAAPSPIMLSTHLAAAIVSVLAVRHGERLVAAVSSWVRRLLPRPAHVSPAPPVRRRLVAATRPRRMRGRVARTPLSRRGPPRVLSPRAA